MKRTKEEAAVTREKLLKAGLAVFSRLGYSATTLEDVAREAGVTRGAIYWHFGSKAELYKALADTYSNRTGEIMQQAASEGGSFADIIRRIFTRMLSALESDPDLRAVMEMSLFKTEYTNSLITVFEEGRQRNQALLEMLTGAIQQGIEAGELRADLNARDAALASIGYLNGLSQLWLISPDSFSIRDRAPALTEIFLKGILPAGK